jgi:putative hydrolase of the HAD superfamily
MHQRLPKVVLLDLDDTILDDSSAVSSCWRRACLAHQSDLDNLGLSVLYETIGRVSAWYWADPERHRTGRLDLGRARCQVVEMSLARLGARHPDLAAKIADAYGMARDEGIQPFDGAIETLRWLRSSGCRLALLTNGAAAAQRGKIERFRLSALFEHVLIEGELGFGKPDLRVYHTALDRMAANPADVWMIGDNLEWDVAPPQQLGIFSIWVDAGDRRLPAGCSARPNRIVRRLSDLLERPSGTQGGHAPSAEQHP